MSSTQPQQVAAPQTRGGGALKAGAFFLVVALAAFGFGARAQSFVEQYNPSEVICGEDVMTPDDVCLAYGDGGGDYGEVRAQQEQSHQINERIASISPMVGIGTGALAVLLFVVGFVKLASRRTNSAVAP
jgi:hypothetical protein